MNDSTSRAAWTRREMLMLMGAAMVPGVALASFSTPESLGYFASLRRAADLEPLSHRIRTTLEQQPADTLAGLQDWSAASAAWIKTVVGDQWITLTHTVPNLVQEDLMAGRTREVMGLNLTATEVAMLLTDD